MATNGFFTYHDLYGGKPESYHQPGRLLSSDTTQLLPVLNVTFDPTSTAVAPLALNSSITAQSDGQVNQFIRLIPFAYLHWLLIALALFLTSLLTIIFTYYCRSYCRKHSKSSDEKKQPFSSFYRYRQGKPQDKKVRDIYEPSSPPASFPFPSPMRPCPSRSIDRRNSRLLREGLDAVGSPRTTRTDVSHTEPSSSFSSSASDLLAEMKSRLSTHASSGSQSTDRSYETQRAKMALADDAKSSSSLVNLN